jgi:hypothetical protein
MTQWDIMSHYILIFENKKSDHPLTTIHATIKTTLKIFFYFLV